MKKLIVAAVLAGSMVAVAEEAVVKPAEAAPAAAERVNMPVKRGPLTEEQRAELRVRREKMIAQRKAEMEKKAVEIIKKYGLDDEKAKALYKELQESMRPVRRPRPVAKPADKPVAKDAPKAE